MSALGHQLPRGLKFYDPARPLRPKAHNEQTISVGPLCANSGCEQMQQVAPLLGHLVGAGEQRRRATARRVSRPLLPKDAEAGGW
jgi:hypothetical protein